MLWDLLSICLLGILVRAPGVTLGARASMYNVQICNLSDNRLEYLSQISWMIILYQIG